MLVVVALFGSYFLAKYVSTLISGDGATVAKWTVEAVSDTDTLNLISGNVVGVYTLNITSTSEVSASYSVVLSNVPSGLEVKIDDGQYQTAGSSGSIVFGNVGAFAAGGDDVAHTHTITFDSPLDSSALGINEVDVGVEFVQDD